MFKEKFVKISYFVKMSLGKYLNYLDQLKKRKALNCAIFTKAEKLRSIKRLIYIAQILNILFKDVYTYRKN